MNDGHTRESNQFSDIVVHLYLRPIVWIPHCYINWEAVCPTPIVSLSVGGRERVYIAPDAGDFVSLAPNGFTKYYDSIGFDWKRLAGSEVLQIESMDPYDYVDLVADTVTGNYLDHGVRVNSVFTSYRLLGASFSQRFGDLAGRSFSPIENLTFVLIPVGETEPETVTVPFLHVFMGNSFSDADS